MDTNLTNHKKEEVILAWDKNNPKELEIASGVDEQGNLRKTVAQQGQSLPFIDVNGNSNLFDAFLHNFSQQLFRPQEVIFVRLPLELLEQVWNAVGKKLSKLVEINPDFLFNPQSILNPSTTQISLDKIDWQQAAQWGITKEGLEASQQNGDRSLENLLALKKTKLLDVVLNVGNTTIQSLARLQLQPNSDGTFSIVPTLKQEKVNLDRPYFGYVFNDQDKHSLETTSFANKVIELQLDPNNPEIKTPCLVGIDTLTNTVEHIEVSKIRFDQPIHGEIPSLEVQQILRSGGCAYMSNMKTKDGKPMDAGVRVDPVNGLWKLDFSMSKRNQTKKQTQGQQYSQYQGRNNQYGRNNYNQERNSYQNNYKQGRNSYNKKRNF